LRASSVHGEPEQLVVGEPFERGSPVLDVLGLSLVEQERPEHVPCFPRPLRDHD